MGETTVTACWADPLSRTERRVLADKLAKNTHLLYAASRVARRQGEHVLARSLLGASNDCQDLRIDVTERAEMPASKVSASTETDPFPPTCSWCINSPATHLLIWDYREDGESHSDRHQETLCGPCAHGQTVLTANITGWWLYELVPDHCEEEGKNR